MGLTESGDTFWHNTHNQGRMQSKREKVGLHVQGLKEEDTKEERQIENVEIENELKMGGVSLT